MSKGEGWRGCNRIVVPGPLDRPVRSDDGMSKRWVCTCGSNGNWVYTGHLRERTVELRLRDQYAGHVRRTARREATA